MAKTIKIRIPVAVSANGQWYAAGSSDDAGKSWVDNMLSCNPCDGPERAYWVEAELELPDEIVVQASGVVDEPDNGLNDETEEA